MNDLVKYCKSQKCRECAFYADIAFTCSLGPTIHELAKEAEGYASAKDAIKCANEIYDVCSKNHMETEDKGHCGACQYEYKNEFGFWRCTFGRSVCGFDNPSRWDFVKNMKAPEKEGLF